MSNPKDKTHIPFTTKEVSTQSGLTFTLRDCASTAVQAFGYSPEKHELAVLFQPDSQTLYVYEGVSPALAKLIDEAPSKGRIINETVKQLPFRKEILK